MAFSKPGKCAFSTRWCEDPSFWWVKECPSDKFSAKCILCNTSFSLSNMGKTSLVSHARGAKHSARQANRKSTVDFFSRPKTKVETSVPSVSSMSTCNTAEASTKPLTNNADACPTDPCSVDPPEVLAVPKCSIADTMGDIRNASAARPTLKSYLQKDEETRAEILLCLLTADRHFSCRDMGAVVQLFPLLFPESKIAQNIKLQKDKVSYTLTYGIAPVFKEDLLAIIQNCEMFSVGFDESLNKVSQHQQMDLTVKFWHPLTKAVQTRYLTSVFLGKTAATDLLIGFCDAVSGLGMKKLVQVSMDGPNVNKKFLNDLKQKMKDGGNPDDGELIDFGSCGLHVVHGSFKKGCKDSKWELIEFLRALYNLFKFVPSRRADFTAITGSSVFPMKFCAIRWVENKRVAGRAIFILENIEKYVARVEEVKTEQRTIKPKPRLTISVPDCKSYDVVRLALKDKLLLAKLTFSEAMAAEVEPFLTEFQSANPLAPFLYSTLQALLREIQTRFVKEKVLSGKSPEKIDVTDKESLMRPEDIHLGFATKPALRKCTKKAKVSNKDMIDFRSGCLLFFKGFVEKMLEKSPLCYSFARAITCIDPKVAMDCRLRKLRTECALEKLTDLNRVTGSVADAISREFTSLASMEHVKQGCASYYRSETRLDHFWFEMVGDRQNFDNFKFFVKLLCILFHGNADLERGFSINKECLVDNLLEDSLIALRLVCDGVKSAGGIQYVPITKRMILSARNASSRRKEMLEKRKKDREAANQSEKKKRETEFKIKELNAKKLKLRENAEKDIAAMDEEVRELKGQN